MKKKMGSTLAVYPLPVAVVGSEQNGRINYNAIAHVGIMDFQTVSLSMGKMHYSNQGIKENKTLSINLTSMEMFDKMTYVREDVLTDGKIDYIKVMPVLDAPLSGYFRLGEEIKVKKEKGE